MIITCTSCHTHYEIPAESMPPEGRKVRCTKCKHLWLATPEEPKKDPIKQEKPIITPKKCPTQKPVKTAPVPWWLVALPLSLIAASLVILLVGAYGPVAQKFPFTEPFFKLTGIHSSDGLELDDVRLKMTQLDGRINWKIEGVIQNTSSHERKLTPVRFTLKDEHKKIIASHTMKFKRQEIGPREEHLFEADIAYPEPDKVAFIVLDIGNKWELKVRK